jgi:dihydrofolate reductase
MIIRKELIMGKLTASIFVSLDNKIVGENEDMSWVIDNFDPEMGGDMGEVMDSMQAILLGHTTYDIMVKHWPGVTGVEDPGADEMNHTPKLVFSKALPKAGWGKYDNATVIREIIPVEIERMKKQSDKKWSSWVAPALSNNLRALTSSMNTSCGFTRSSWGAVNFCLKISIIGAILSLSGLSLTKMVS